MNYYTQKIYIAKVDKDDNVLGKIERWEAHEKGVLHRAFSVAIFYEDQVVLQHRKHPVFDDVFDISISSHQLFEGETLQTDLTPVYSTLVREFNLRQSDLAKQPEFLGKIYYQVKDIRSKYIEHEVCYFYSCSAKKLPQPNLEFAYGFSLRKIEDLKNPKNSLYPALAPWVKEATKAGLL